MRGGWRVGGVIFMSLLYYMFQSILNTFAFGYFFGVKKLIIFTDGGYLPPRAAFSLGTWEPGSHEMFKLKRNFS